MERLEQHIESYRKKMVSAESMTDLLVAMSSWQSFSQRKGLTAEQKKPVDEAYLETEAKLITNVKSSLW